MSKYMFVIFIIRRLLYASFIRRRSPQICQFKVYLPQTSPFRSDVFQGVRFINSRIRLYQFHWWKFEIRCSIQCEHGRLNKGVIRHFTGTLYHVSCEPLRIFWNDDTTCPTRVPRVLSTTGWKARNPARSRQHSWYLCRAGCIAISENPRGLATHMVYGGWALKLFPRANNFSQSRFQQYVLLLDLSR